MVKPHLSQPKYASLNRGLLEYLNFSNAEKTQLFDYLLGKVETPKFEPKIDANKLESLKNLLSEFSAKHDKNVDLREWVKTKKEELKFLDEYLEFLDRGNQEKFKKQIYYHYGELDKSLFHFHLNDLLRQAETKKRNKAMLKQLKELLAKEIATDYSKHPEHQITIRDFKKTKSMFDVLYASETALIKDALKNFDNDHEYTAQELKRLLAGVLKFYKLDDLGWKVVIGKNTEKVSVNRIQKEVRVSSAKFRFSKGRMTGLLLHEICAHIIAHPNITSGNKSLSRPQIEEGLGVFLEQIVLSKPHYMRVYRYLAIGLALGIDGKPRNMKKVFEILWRIRYLVGQSSSVKLAQEYALKEVIRIFRGMPVDVSGVVLTKDKVYLEGNQYIWKMISEDNMNIIFGDFLEKQLEDNILKS